MGKEYTISLSVEQLRIIAAALQELPYRVAKPVLDHMAAQTEAQDDQQAKAAVPPVAPNGEEVSQ